MSAETWYLSLVTGERRGLVATIVRAGLWIISLAYGCVIRVRNKYYDKLAMLHWLDAPVISVGNLTVGGTGKTPMTHWLCQRLLDRGRKPAVLSRGYKAAPEGQADELLLTSRRVPEAVTIAHANRAAAGALAVAEYGARAIVLDDGFQHRRVGRDLDIVLIDATCPFGFGAILPRGLLREPVSSLRRADAVVITRHDQVDSVALEAIRSTVQQHRPDAVIVQASHRPIGFVDIEGREAQPPAGRVGVFCGIARPDAFEATLASTGLTLAGSRHFDDHHAYDEADIAAINDWVRTRGFGALVTTEKDAVKLAALGSKCSVPIFVLRIELAMSEQDEVALTSMIDEMLEEHESTETGNEIEETSNHDSTERD